MKVVSVCFALVVLSSMFVTAARAQSLEENEHYQSFRSWAIDTQQPDPVPNMFKFCIQAYDKMIASGVSPSTQVPEDQNSGILWKGTVQEIKEKWCDAGLKKITDDVTADTRHTEPTSRPTSCDSLSTRHTGVSRHMPYLAANTPAMQRSSLTLQSGSSMSARQATSSNTARVVASVILFAAIPSTHSTSFLAQRKRSTATILRRRRTGNARQPGRTHSLI